MLGAINPFLSCIVIVHSCHVQTELVVGVTITPFLHQLFHHLFTFLLFKLSYYLTATAVQPYVFYAAKVQCFCIKNKQKYRLLTQTALFFDVSQ